MEINFPAKVYINIAIFNEVKKSGTGLDQLLQHATKDCADLIKQLLTYDPEERINAKQALRHPYFKELREVEQ